MDTKGKGKVDKSSATPENTKKQVMVRVDGDQVKRPGKKKTRSTHSEVVSRKDISFLVNVGLCM